MAQNARRHKYIYKSDLISHTLPKKACSVQYKDNVEQLNAELEEVYNKIALCKEEFKLRENIFSKFKEVVEKEFAKLGYKVTLEKYGSFMTGTMVGQSDIDVTILFDKDSPLNSMHVNEVLKMANKILLVYDLCDGEIIHIKKARIPILKLSTKQYRLKMDISINQIDGVEAAKFVKKKLSENKELKYLVVLFKYFMKRRNLSNCFTGGMNAYGQFLLIFHFIQLHPLYNVSSIKDNLGVYLLDFFQFISMFPFTKAKIDATDLKYTPNDSGDEVYIVDPASNNEHNVTGNAKNIGRVKNISNTMYLAMITCLKQNIKQKEVSAIWFKFNQNEFQERKQNVKKFKETIEKENSEDTKEFIDDKSD